MAVVSGVNVDAITPRRAGPEVDLAATFELIDYLAASGVSGIVLMGATGEFLHFELNERIRLVALAVKRSRVPVIAGVGHSTLDGALALGRAAADAGAAALLLAPPHYFRYRQEEIREFYLRFASELKGGPPVFLYNIPGYASAIDFATAIELLSTGLFAGIEDSSGCWDDFARLQAAREKLPFTLLAGSDAIFRRARAAGADGAVSGCACAAPELMLALDRAIVAGDAGTADRLEARLREFIAWLDVWPAPVGIREATALRGIEAGPHAAPLGPLGEAKLGEFREWFGNWLPAVQQECQGV